MKQPPGPTQGLSMAQCRQTQLVAACSPVWLFNAAVHAGAILRSIVTIMLNQQDLQATLIEVAHVALYTAVHYIPTATIRMHRPDRMASACAIAYGTNSVLLLLIAWGISPFTAATRGVLATRGSELIVDAVLAYQYQLSLPVMAILHAFRQLAWMAIIYLRMDGDPYRLIVRGIGNWCLMMLLSAFLEMRLKAAHQKACRAMQQQEQQQQEQQQQKQKHQDKQDQQSEHPQSMYGITKQMAGVRSQLLERTLNSAIDLHAGASRNQANASPKLFPGEARVQLPAVPPRAVPAAAREVRGMSAWGSVQQAQLAPNQQQAALALLQAIKSKHALSYKRSRHGGSDIVHVKVEGVELEHLPPDLPELLQKQLSYCMPGVTMTGLALRSGCVVLTLDLMRYAEEGTAALSADGMRDLITRLMQSQTMGQVLEDGAPMCIQMPDELALCRWDRARGSYTSEGAPALESADWKSCRVVSAGPVVHCLSDNATHTTAMSGDVPASHQLSLTVVLELPSNCQLHGWQSAGTSAATGSGGLLQNLPQNGPVVDATLLARRLDGGYLPVVVRQVSCVGMSTAGSPLQVTAQVVVSVAGEGPAALHLELWCKQADAAGRAVGGTDNQLSWVPGHMPGLELLVAHMPLLVLPGSWKEAAAELQQHIDNIGAVQPQHAVSVAAHTSGTIASSPPNTIKYSTHGLGSETGTLHGMPPAASQPSMSDRMHSGQAMQHNRSPQASDSASSHNPPHSDPPSNIPECDPICCLLEDLGVLLTHQPTVGNTLAAAVPDGVISQLGDDLLVYAVQHGLASVASVIADTMQRVEQHGAASTAARPAIVSPSAWLLRVAGCASNSDSDGLPGGKGWRMSLLHAAMASGSAEMLGHVFRWGTLYGGPDWAWPWELEDATGCTALHLAAAQPAAGACAALLKTTTCMLPAAQVQAARNAWLQSQGGLGATPAQVFALAPNGGNVGEMWGDVAPVHPSLNATSTQLGSTTGSTGPGPSAASASDSPQETPAPVTEQCSTQIQSWLGSMVEVWTSREPEEYHVWAKHQDSLSVWYWAAALIVMSAAAMQRSAVAGCLQYEWLHLFLYTWLMIPAVVATAGGNERLGSTKVWLILAQVMPICSWVAKSRLLNHQAAAWISAATTGADMIYVVLVGVAVDKVSMPQLVLSRAIEALAQSYAYKIAGFPYPLLRALAVQVTVLVISMVARTRKLRAFYRWQAKQQELKQRGHSRSSPAERLLVKKRA